MSNNIGTAVLIVVMIIAALLSLGVFATKQGYIAVASGKVVCKLVEIDKETRWKCNRMGDIK